MKDYAEMKRAAGEAVLVRAPLQKLATDLRERLAKAEAANEPGAWHMERAALTAQIAALREDVAAAHALMTKNDAKAHPPVPHNATVEARDPTIRALDRDLIAGSDGERLKQPTITPLAAEPR